MCSKPSMLPNKQKSRRLDQLNIRAIEHLGRHVSLPEELLRKMTECPGKFFRVGHFIDKNGTKRPKAQPIGPLSKFHIRLNSLLQRVRLPASIHGGCVGKSYITNAQEHVGQPLVMKFDIQKYFPNICRGRVFRLFNERLGCTPEVADVISRLTTFNDELAQGAPASTIIAAIIAEPILLRIQNLILPENGVVTVYIDDFGVSGPQSLARHKNLIRTIIRQCGFVVRADKTRVMRSPDEQILTGVALNSQLSLPRDRQSALWDFLRSCEERAKEEGKFPSLAELVKLQSQARNFMVFNPGAGSALLKRVTRLIKRRTDSTVLTFTEAPVSTSGRPAPRN